MHVISSHIHVLSNQDLVKQTLNRCHESAAQIDYYQDLNEWSQKMHQTLGSHVFILDETQLTGTPAEKKILRELNAPHLVLCSKSADTLNKSDWSRHARLVPLHDFSLSFASLFLDFGAAESRVLMLTHSLLQGQTQQAMMIHELRSPLMVIKRKCEKILESIPSPEYNDPWVQEIVKDCNKVLDMSVRIQVLSENLMEQSQFQIRATKQQQSKKTVLQKSKLIDLIWAAIDDCLALYGDKKFDIIEDIDPSLTISCDKDAFVRSMVNLIKNSFEAIARQDVRWVKILAEKVQRDLVIKIVDNGPGIEQPQKLFDSFHTTKKTQGGVGLGLQVVKSYFESIGGEVQYTQDAGHTCFLIKIKNAFRG